MKKNLFPMFLAVAFLFGVSGMAFSASKDAEYPTKQVKIVVPYRAGGGSDLMIRVVAEYLSKEWNQPVIIENKSGGSGIVGVSQGLRAKADGYNAVACTASETTLATASYIDPPIDMNNVTYVVRLSTAPNGFIVKADAPWDNLKEFGEWLKEDPSQLTWTGTGKNSICTYILSEYMQALGILDDFSKTRMIATTGSADSLVKVAGGSAILQTGNIFAPLAMVKAGKLKVLAVEPEKYKFLPQFPSAEESSGGIYKGSIANWIGIIMPDGVDESVVKKWNDTFEKLSTNPDYIEALSKRWSTSDYLPSDVFEKFVKDEIAKYTKFAETLGIRQ